MDQDQINKNAEDALKRANVRLRLDIFFEADGIRAADIPDNAEIKMAEIITKRLPPFIPAAMIDQPGCWRLIMRAVQVEASQRIDG